jgi:histidine kinase family protein
MIRTIKFKMLVVIVVCLGAGALRLAWSFNQAYEESAARLTKESIQGAAASFAGLERTSTDLMTATIGALGHDPELRAAMAARDPARALAVSQALYRGYRARFGITHWNYWEPESSGDMTAKGLRNLLRVGTPDMHGDFVERVTLARVARERALVSGLDLGFTGLVLRVLVPVEEGTQLLGYLELGKEIGTFLRDMKKTSGYDYGLLVDKSRMDQKKWATMRTTAGLRNNWDDSPALLLSENTTADNDIFDYRGAIAALPEAGLPLGIAVRDGRSFARGVFPIRDVAGEKVAALFVLRDVTAAHDEMRAAQRQALLAVAVVMLVLAVVLGVVFELLVVRRLRRMTAIATRVVGGEFDLEIVPSADDELGEFETLFEQFRMLFVELIGEAQQRATGTGGPPPRGGR